MYVYMCLVIVTEVSDTIARCRIRDYDVGHSGGTYSKALYGAHGALYEVDRFSRL